MGSSIVSADSVPAESCALIKSKFHEDIARCIAPNRFLRYHKELIVGRLSNGLEYRVLRHPFPIGKVHGHLVVNAGSLHEEDHEQGLAHFLEHCVFLGTQKYPSMEALQKAFAALGMSFGADTNAYTDFNETVYTLSCPTAHHLKHANEEGQPRRIEKEHLESDKADGNVLQLLTLLKELGWNAILETGPIFENEKLGVVTEAQMRNTVQYRVEVRLLQQLHSRTVLPQRMPIGDMGQLKGFTDVDLKRFYRKWYVPANMCLVVVGDCDPAEVERMILGLFGSSPVVTETEKGGSGLTTTSTVSFQSLETGKQTFFCDLEKDSVLTHVVRNIVETNPASSGTLLPDDMVKGVHTPPEPGTMRVYTVEDYAAFVRRPGRAKLPDQSLSVFRAPREREVVYQHDLLRLVNITWSSMLPFTQCVDERELLVSLVDTVAGLIVQTRFEDVISTSGQPPFLGASWGFTNSARENCSWNALGVVCETSRWREGLQACLAEVLRLVHHGVSVSELSWALTTTLKKYRDGAQQEESRDAADVIEELTDDWISGTVTLSCRQKYRLALAHSSFITAELIHKRLTELFFFVTSYFDDGFEEMLKEGGSHVPGVSVNLYPENVARGGLFVTAPTTKLPPGTCTGEKGASAETSNRTVKARVGSHVSLEIPTFETLPVCTQPEPFILSREMLLDAMCEGLAALDAHHGVELPSALVDEAALDALLAESKPKWKMPRLDKVDRVRQQYFVSKTTDLVAEPDRLASPGGAASLYFHRPSQVYCGLLDNGVAVNMKQTRFEPNRSCVKLLFVGGRALEPVLGHKPQLLNLGISTLLDGGISGIPQHILSRLLAMWGLEVHGDVDQESTMLYVEFETTDMSRKAFARALSLLRGCLVAPNWDPRAFERQKRNMILAYEASAITLEFQSSVQITQAVFPGETRLLPANKALLESYTLEEAQRAVLQQLQPAFMEVQVVGDFEVHEAKDAIQRYLGTLASVVHQYDTVPGGPVMNHVYEDGNPGRQFLDHFQSTGDLNNMRAPQLFSNSQVLSVFVEDNNGVDANRPLRVPSGKTATCNVPSSTLGSASLLAPEARQTAFPEIPLMEAAGGAVPLLDDVTETATPPSATDLVEDEDEKLQEGDNDDLESFQEESLQSPLRCIVTLTMRGHGRYSSPETWLSDPELKAQGISSRHYNPSFRYRVWKIIEEIANHRLYVALREKRGLAYACEMNPAVFETWEVGTVSVTLTPEPFMAAAAWDSLLFILWDLTHKNPPTEEEFLAAKNPIVSSVKSHLQSNDAWIALLRGLQLRHHPTSLTQIVGIEDFHRDVTLQDVKCLLKKDLVAFPSVTCISVSGSAELRSVVDEAKATILKRIEEQGYSRLDCLAAQDCWRSSGTWEETLGPPRTKAEECNVQHTNIPKLG